MATLQAVCCVALIGCVKCVQRERGGLKPRKILRTDVLHGYPHSGCHAKNIWMVVRHGSRNPSGDDIVKIANDGSNLAQDIVDNHKAGRYLNFEIKKVIKLYILLTLNIANCMLPNDFSTLIGSETLIETGGSCARKIWMPFRSGLGT